jgi:hypothetical protein
VELVAILRTLKRRWPLVALGAVLAIAIAVTSAKPAASTAVASERVMLDTPVSELSHASPVGADGLGARTTILGNQVASAPAQARIAQAAGIPRVKFVAMAPSTLPLVASPLARAAETAWATTPERYVLRISIDPALPLVIFDALAPTRREATAILKASVQELTDLSASDSRRVVTEPLGESQTRVIPGSTGRVRALALAFVAFALWCGCVVLFSALRSSALPGLATTATKPAR